MLVKVSSPTSLRWILVAAESSLLPSPICNVTHKPCSRVMLMSMFST